MDVHLLPNCRVVVFVSLSFSLSLAARRFFLAEAGDEECPTKLATRLCAKFGWPQLAPTGTPARSARLRAARRLAARGDTIIVGARATRWRWRREQNLCALNARWRCYARAADQYRKRRVRNHRDAPAEYLSPTRVGRPNKVRGPHTHIHTHPRRQCSEAAELATAQAFNT